MNWFSFGLWTLLALALAALAGIQTVDQVAEMLAISAVFCAGGSAASLLAILRMKLSGPKPVLGVETRLEELQGRVEATEHVVSGLKAANDFDRLLGGGPTT